MALGEWVFNLLSEVSYSQNLKTLKPIRQSYESQLGDFEELVESEVWDILRSQGLLIF